MMAPLKRWTEEEDKTLLELKAAGRGISLIAKELRRTESSISGRLVILKKRSQLKSN